MKSLINKIFKRNKKFIIIVSGLPRSGTSMMMRILDFGGIPVVTDQMRKADKDNPRGYYEFEKVKQIEKDSFWLDDCYGKAFKMTSVLLYYLPTNHKYKIVFMKRGLKEILLSQKAMLNHCGRKGANENNNQLAERYAIHLEKIENWLAAQKNIEVLYVNYNQVVNAPIENAKKISHFLGSQLNTLKMSKAVEKSLYRQRKTD